MSAIAAVVHWNGRPVDRTLLESVNACVRHRCPDGSWTWTDGPVGMAQADLATLPEDEPGVPVTAGRLRIAASCRIDNRDDLRRTLPHDVLPRCNTDAALILAAYQAWGEACVDRLIGDFAFIIWDDDRKSIFAARDLSGARQLFYYQSNDTLFLASDRTQILQDPRVPLEVDEQQLIEYLTPFYQWTSGWDQGLFRGFHVLDGACMLRAAQGHVIVQRFWEWREREPDRRPEQQVIEEYLHTLEEAVRCRLRSRSRRVAVELSGGLDSPAIASLATRLSNGSGPDLHTLSLVFDEFPETDERQRIQAVLDRYPLSPHFLVADRLYEPAYLGVDWSPRSVMGLQEITGVLAGDCLYDMAVQLGCRVVLTGQMGDSLNQGCEWVYFALLRRGDFRESLRRFRIDWNRSRKRTLLGLLFHGLMPMMPMPLLKAALMAREYQRGMFCNLPPYFPSSLQDGIREMDQAIRIDRVRQVRVRCPAIRSTLDELLPPMVACTVPGPYPLEFRYPYTDRRLVEMVLSMPQELKWEHEEREHPRARRLHHRRAMAGILPDEVRVANSGVNFSPVIRHCLSPLVMRKWLTRGPRIHIFERGYVLPDRFLDAINGSTTNHHYLSAMLSVEAWFRALAPGGQMHRLIPTRHDGKCAS